jgi:ADP-heptose:LPS heptosyltransferase
VSRLTEQGWTVLVTGSAAEKALTADVADGATAAGAVVDLGGAHDLGQLAWVLARATAVVVANTGPAHLAAAVGAPVVSLFAPVVPLVRWGPYTDHRRVLGDQSAACRESRAAECPIPGHPCLSTVLPEDVVDAVASLALPRQQIVATATGGVT